jgi:amino acid permease
MAFGDTLNLRKNIPRAVKQTFWRIAVFYILDVIVLGMAMLSDNEMLAGAISNLELRCAKDGRHYTQEKCMMGSRTPTDMVVYDDLNV